MIYLLIANAIHYVCLNIYHLFCFSANKEPPKKTEDNAWNEFPFAAFNTNL